MSRGRGGYIGFNRVPAASAVNSAASGIWTLREAEALKRAGTWPRAGELPEQISGLQLWLDASDASTLFNATSGGSLVAADGGVARWEDKSGNARHATQSTSGDRPLRKTSVQGGKDVLRFDGSNDHFRIDSIATFLAGTNSPFTIIGAAKSDLSDSSQTFLAGGRSISNDGFVATKWGGFSPNSTKLQVVREPDSGTGGKANTGGTNVGTSARVAAWRFDGSNGRVFVNGAADSTASDLVLASSLSINRAAIGALVRSDAQRFFDGDIFEICVYDSALSDANREAVENYLLAKWGIT